MAVKSIVATGQIVPELAHYDRAMVELLARRGMPGAALAIAKDDRLRFARGYGLANIEDDEPVPNRQRLEATDGDGDSRFVGYDFSETAITAARAEAGLTVLHVMRIEGDIANNYYITTRP